MGEKKGWRASGPCATRTNMFPGTRRHYGPAPILDQWGGGLVRYEHQFTAQPENPPSVRFNPLDGPMGAPRARGGRSLGRGWVARCRPIRKGRFWGGAALERWGTRAKGASRAWDAALSACVPEPGA